MVTAKWGHCSRFNKFIAPHQIPDQGLPWLGNHVLNIQEQFTM